MRILVENIFYGGTTMNKVELINAVAAKADISKKDADKAVAAVLASIQDALVLK